MRQASALIRINQPVPNVNVSAMRHVGLSLLLELILSPGSLMLHALAHICTVCQSDSISAAEMPAGAKRRQLCILPLLSMLTRIGRTNAQCSPSLSGLVVGRAESPAAVSLCTLGPIARRL